MSTRVASDYAHTADLRTAAKPYVCAERRPGCLVHIKPGDPYVSHTVFPGHDMVQVDHPTRLPECTECWVLRKGSYPQAEASDV